MSYSWAASRSTVRTDGLPAIRAVPNTVGATPAGSREGVGPVVGKIIEPVHQDLELRRLAAELAPMVDVWQRLLAQHTPDRTGRCRTCTKGGTGLPSQPWPCSIHGIAELARRRYDAVCERPDQAS